MPKAQGAIYNVHRISDLPTRRRCCRTRIVILHERLIMLKKLCSHLTDLLREGRPFGAKILRTVLIRMVSPIKPTDAYTSTVQSIVVETASR